jgi:type IV pilus assembly protein PilE
MRKGHGCAAGFSLTELLIVLVLVGILTAFAYPSYKDHVRRAHRAQARARLMEAAQFMQRFYAVNDRFDLQAGVVGVDATVTLPANLRATTVPATYLISLQSVARGEFVLAATPVGVMAGDPCGTLTLNQAGEQSASGSWGAAACWR